MILKKLIRPCITPSATGKSFTVCSWGHFIDRCDSEAETGFGPEPPNKLRKLYRKDSILSINIYDLLRYVRTAGGDASSPVVQKTPIDIR